MQLAELALDRFRLLADDIARMPRRRRLDEDHPAFLGRRRHVLDAARNHVEVALLQHDVGSVPIADDENALADEEELVLVGVAVPDELALDLALFTNCPFARATTRGDQYSASRSNSRSMFNGFLLR